MPLYQSIAITKLGSPKATSAFIRTVSSKIIYAGGNVRTARILTDRVLSTPLKAMDKATYVLGRYIQFLYDGNPRVAKTAEQSCRENLDFMKVITMRSNDPLNSAVNLLKPVEQFKIWSGEEKEDMMKVLAAVRTKELKKKQYT